ncbi:DMT family transporter [Amycolatopsis sp. TRM77291]
MFQRVALGAGCAAVMAWATNAVVASNALASMNATQFLALEFAAASVVLAVVGLVQGSGIVEEGDCGRMVSARGVRLRLRLRPAPFVVGVIGVVGTAGLQVMAFTYAPVVKANLLAYSWPLLVALWCVFTTRMSRPWLYLAVVGSGLVGVWFMLDRSAATDVGNNAALGYLFAAGSALCMACYTIAAGRMRLPIVGSLLPAVATGAGVFLVIALAASMPWPQWEDLLQPIYIGSVPMAAGYILWTFANARGQPVWIATLGYLTPAISTVALVVIGTQTALSASELVGIGLVLGCTAVTGYLTLRTQFAAR